MTVQEYQNMRKSQALDGKKRTQKPREGKYNAHKVRTSYGAFDSVHEHNVFLNLLDLREKGIISELRRQVEFELIPAHYEKVQKQLKRKVVEREVCIEKKCSYFADFTYMENGVLHVVDAKGMKTEVYKIKKKLMLHVHGIKIEEL